MLDNSLHPLVPLMNYIDPLLPLALAFAVVSTFFAWRSSQEAALDARILPR
jgi:hypothetical protein